MVIISNYYYHFPLLRNNALLRFRCSNFRGHPPTKMMINVKDRDRHPPKVIASFRESMNIFYLSSLLEMRRRSGWWWPSAMGSNVDGGSHHHHHNLPKKAHYSHASSSINARISVTRSSLLFLHFMLMVMMHQRNAKPLRGKYYQIECNSCYNAMNWFLKGGLINTQECNNWIDPYLITLNYIQRVVAVLMDGTRRR